MAIQTFFTTDVFMNFLFLPLLNDVLQVPPVWTATVYLTLKNMLQGKTSRLINLILT